MFQLLGYNTHKPEFIYSFNKDQLFNMKQLNIKVLLFQKAIHTLQFRWLSIHFIAIIYQLIQLLKMITVALLSMHSCMETDKQYSMFRSWKFQDNEIHCHQLAWSMNQLDYIIYGCNISSSFFTVMYYCLQFFTITLLLISEPWCYFSKL